MADLAYLYSRLSTYKSKKSNCESKKRDEEKKRDEAKKREQAVEKIRKDLAGYTFDRHTVDVNAKGSHMKTDVKNAIKGVTSPGNIESQISNSREKVPEEDGHLSDALSELQTEVSELKTYHQERVREIESLKIQIQDYNNKIRDTEREIREEEHRIFMENLKNSLGL